MNILLKSIAFFAISFSFSPFTFAEEQAIDREDVYVFFAKYLQTDVPDSFQYIDLKYTDIVKDSQLEDALQVLVYLDLIKNVDVRVGGHKKVSIDILEQLSQKILGIKILSEISTEDKKIIFTQKSDLEAILNILEERKKSSQEKQGVSISSSLSVKSLGKKQAILEDVYKTLNSNHYNRESFQENQLIESAIKGLAEGADDKYTTYFPPVDSSSFFQGLDGEYEGIGAYVDMPNPGKLIIVSPIVGSPAQAAGLKGGDHITHVDGKEISENTSSNEAVSWIKGPAGTYVKLTIIREGAEYPLNISVKREKITLKDVDYQTMDNNIFYIQIKNFGERVDVDFLKALEAVKEEKSINKIIIDVRNNPGGYLGKTSNMLGFFLEKGAKTAIVSYGKKDVNYTSLGLDILDLSDYEIIFLQNGGTASASEILIGTIKDYYPEVTIIGEQSFGKGSVQSLRRYYDGSTLKFTSAKWFTGKTRQGIDGIGITPDILLDFDDERFQKYKKDNQLEKAINY